MATFKKRYEIVKTRKEMGGRSVDGLDIDKKKTMMFGKSGGMSTSDASLAEAIDAEVGVKSRKHGKLDTVMVMPVDDKRVEEGHNYTFGTVAMPWAEYDELGHRIPEGANNGKEGIKGTEEGREEGIQAPRAQGAKGFSKEDGSKAGGEIEEIAGLA